MDDEKPFRAPWLEALASYKRKRKYSTSRGKGGKVDWDKIRRIFSIGINK